MTSTRLKSKHFTSQQRHEVLLLAEKIGSVAEACRQSGMDRASFYKWKKRFEKEGASALANKKGTGRSHPRKIPDSFVDEIVETALTHPNWGCGKIAEFLSKKGIKVSSPTVQAVFIRRKISTIGSRVSALETECFLRGRKLSSEQFRLIEKNNPSLKEREKAGSYPGEVLVQDTILLGDEFESAYLHVVIDTYSAYLFVHIDNEKSGKIAADMLWFVTRLFTQKDLIVRKVLTDRGYEFTRFGGIYTQTASRNGIEHTITDSHKRNWNGLIERFHTYLRDRIKRAKTGKSIFVKRLDGPAKFIQQIPRIHNISMYSGYPNFGMSPKQCLDKYTDAIHVEK